MDRNTRRRIARIQRDVAISDHLHSNFMPPVSQGFLPYAKRAINACRRGQCDKIIKIPEMGLQGTAGGLVEWLRLEFFVESPEI